MIDISSAKLEKIIIHHVGNRSREEGCQFSKSEATLSTHLKNLLLRHYLLPLTKSKEPSIFYHESDIALNEMHQFSSKIFKNSSEFQKQSEYIVKHLYSTSSHPNIAGGEFIILLFSNLYINQKLSLGLAVLKVESKDDYLDIKDEDGVLQPIEKEGISLNKIQKGALIFSAENYVLAIDILNQKTKYWLDDFLKIIPKQTEDASAKASRDILKGLIAKIENPEDLLTFNKILQHKLEHSEEIALKEFKSLSQNYLDKPEIESVFSSVQERTGFDLHDDLKIQTKSFELYARNIIKRTYISDGINLIVTSNKVKIKKLTIQEKEDGFCAIIDFNIRRIG